MASLRFDGPRALALLFVAAFVASCGNLGYEPYTVGVDVSTTAGQGNVDQSKIGATLVTSAAYSMMKTSGIGSMASAVATDSSGSATPVADMEVCGPSAGEVICLTVPGGPLAGVVAVSATRSGTTSSETLEFYLHGAYLNFEYLRPYAFSWPTNKEVDGTYELSVRLHKGATEGTYVTTTVTLVNGNLTSVLRSAHDWASVYRPQPGNQFALVGNLGAEKPAELKLQKYILGEQPSIFGYLGEVHEFGTWATTLDHYGLANFDDTLSQGSLWGQMASYTLPTPGNHQRYYMTEYQDYWHQRPLWSTTVWNGVRIYVLTSECSADGGCLAGGAQATWLAQQLQTNTESCVMAMWHRPVVSMDAKRSGAKMNNVWSMLASNGGDLVVNADTRDMEEALPMNASLATGQPDSHMVELISGAGAARWVTSYTPSQKIAWRLYKTPGAVWVSPSAGLTSLNWEFRDSSGGVLRNGSVSC